MLVEIKQTVNDKLSNKNAHTIKDPEHTETNRTKHKRKQQPVGFHNDKQIMDQQQGTSSI
jgi:hypothetical protein